MKTVRKSSQPADWCCTAVTDLTDVPNSAFKEHQHWNCSHRAWPEVAELQGLQVIESVTQARLSLYSLSSSKYPHPSQLFRPNTTNNHRKQEEALCLFTGEMQNISITSIASWSFSMSSPFFFSDSAAAFLVVTTVTTLVTVGPVFCKNSLKKLMHYCVKQNHPVKNIQNICTSGCIMLSIFFPTSLSEIL